MNAGEYLLDPAPDFERPEFPEHFDAIFALDMIHFLSDGDLDLTLTRLRSRLQDGQYLFIRSPVRPDGVLPFRRRCSQAFSKLTGTFSVLRTAEQVSQKISHAAFQIVRLQPSGDKPDLVWFIATASMVKKVDRDTGDGQHHNHRVNHNHGVPVAGGEFVQLLQPANPA